MNVVDDHLDALAPPPAPDAPIDPVLGRPLRPAPPGRPAFNPDWTPARHRLLDGWVDVQDRLPDTEGKRITGTPEPTRVGRLAPKLITAQARLANLDRRIPGYWKRADKRRANGDTYWAVMHDAFTKLAAEQDGGRGPTFTHHDKPVESLGKVG
ncbi:hypothetical protein [Gordonia sp. YY1]|uniref:hypothetical protein n=1 Tax=Gordonia sp. YY1 TaxID=396712 RepID=UPI0013315EC8|nr:hypothetical protein [Gordonia sp. YY1]KAF0970095.1 hypothetical protein BPODLACK_01148 [Gordonia sp. YY1]